MQLVEFGIMPDKKMVDYAFRKSVKKKRENPRDQILMLSLLQGNSNLCYKLATEAVSTSQEVQSKYLMGRYWTVSFEIISNPWSITSYVACLHENEVILALLHG